MKWLLILLAGLTFMSCGSDKKSAPVDNTIHLENDEELQSTIAASTVTCMELNCPSNVGKVLFWSKSSDTEGYDFGVCSGTLLDNNTFITNRHCVPEDLHTGSDCSNRMLIQFPKDDYQYREAENVSCNYVDKAYSRENGGPDIAVLKVDSSRYFRENIKRNAHQMTKAKSVYAYTMNPGKGSDAISGYIYKKSCTISEQNILTGRMMPNSSQALIYGADCDVISGNSGSGLFNAKGEMVGLIHSRIDRNDTKNQFYKLGIKTRINTYMGVAVNIGCAADYFQDGTSACVDSFLQTKEYLRNYISQEKRRSEFRNVLDNEVLAYIGDGLKIKLQRKTTPRSYPSYDYSLNTLDELSTALENMYEDSFGHVEGKYVWALVK